MKKEIIYPIFLKCASKVEDTFWRYVYEDLSYGKCPYGLCLQKDYLLCYIRGKEFAYKVDPEKSADVIFQEVGGLLRERAGILSDKEKILERTRLCRQRTNRNAPSSSSSTKKEEWGNVKKKMIRDTLLEQYVLENSQKYNLGAGLAKKVLSMIIVGLMFKTITAKDIVYQNGFIKNIQGFEFEAENIRVSKNILRCKNLVLHNGDETASPKPLHAYWLLYLEDVKLS
jgi:hypothetical protein